jgi:hypothetical protein
VLLGQLGQAPAHTTHPDAQWFPDAALGLFLHWDPASVKGQNIGWSVIPGRRIAARKTPFMPEEVARIVRESDLEAHEARRRRESQLEPDLHPQLHLALGGPAQRA